MANRKRLERVELAAPLLSVLEHTVEFLACPLSGGEMLAVWDVGFPKDVAEALALVRRLKYVRSDVGFFRTVGFYMPELVQYVRLVLPRGSTILFLQWPPGTNRVIPLRVFESTLGEARAGEFKEWAQAAALCTAKQDRAKKTIEDLLRMASTYGQLRRMVPDLVNYLGPEAQLLLDSQERKSPLPPEWAAYPKDNIEQLLLALAEGHLLSGSKRQEAHSEFSWSWIPANDKPRFGL